MQQNRIPDDALYPLGNKSITLIVGTLLFLAFPGSWIYFSFAGSSFEPMLFLSCVMAIFAVMLLVALLHHRRIRVTAYRDGTQVSGCIVRKNKPHLWMKESITVEYVIGNQRCLRTQIIPFKKWYRSRVGDKIPVMAIPSIPKKSVILP